MFGIRRREDYEFGSRQLRYAKLQPLAVIEGQPQPVRFLVRKLCVFVGPLLEKTLQLTHTLHAIRIEHRLGCHRLNSHSLPLCQGRILVENDHSIADMADVRRRR